MRSGSFYRRMLRWRSWMAVGIVGAFVADLPGCDPEVASALVKGLGQTFVSVLEAKFDRSSGSDSTTGTDGGSTSTIPTI